MLLLDKVDPQFRKLTDLLFFTDRVDVDWSNYSILLDNNDDHYQYLWDRLNKSINILWDEAFWNHRLELLFSLQHKKLHRAVDDLFDYRFSKFIKTARNTNIFTHNEYFQYVSLCKVKDKNKESVVAAAKILQQLPYFIMPYDMDLVSIVNNFIPSVFLSLDQYGDACTKYAIQSGRDLSNLSKIEKSGIPIDQKFLFKMSEDLFLRRAINRKNINSLFTILRNDKVKKFIKTWYKEEHRERLLAIIEQCEYTEFELPFMVNIQSILDIDPTIADSLIVSYANKLQARGTGSKKANINRLVRMLKAFPQFSPKKFLVYLSDQNRMSDIKYLVKGFPELKNIIAFI